ncbi:PucR family transcriptional regulator [Nonomuraea typhae]|uniref:PucR family transcriptional regulator n=1 Tax=Nonomuraea typhae TaxID=2603600 RepID=UPI0012F7A087|nr:helix-turn-helix domain-containing protein [Nonomuraea typhae]
MDPRFAALSARLLGRVDELAVELARRVRAAEAELAVVPPDDITAVCAEQLTLSLGHLSGRAEISTASTAANARRRAERGVPLAALLHSYRVGLQFMWESFVAEAGSDEHPILIDSATEMWLGLDLMSEAIRGAYREVEAERGRDRELAFDALLGTDPVRIRQSADALGLPHRGRFHVIAAGPDAELPPGAVWRHLPTQRLAVLSLPGNAAFPGLRGGRYGVSPAYEQISQTAAALRLARLALAAAPEGEGVSHYGERPVATLIASSLETADDLALRVLGRLLELPAGDRDALLATAHAWFAAGGSTARTAEALFCHRNTVRYRLGRVKELTGRSVDHPREAAELFLALETHYFRR